VLHQLGRLLAGPLEDLGGAIDAYRRAVSLDPERAETRAALGELLAHSPDHWREALAHQRVRIEEDPTCVGALRTLVEIARQHGADGSAAGGVAILKSLGLASPSETEPAQRVRFPGVARLEGALAEKLRCVAQEVSGEIASALDASQSPTPSSGSEPLAAFRAAALDAEGRLAAPALVPLSDVELAEVLSVVCALVLDPDSVRGEGRLVNALSSALGRRHRRKLRRHLSDVTLASIEHFDFVAWRSDLRALATSVALEETGADLRTALVALLPEPPIGLGEMADITPLLANSPHACALLRRALERWLKAF